MRGDDHADVGLDRLDAAEALELAELDHPQQLDLEVRREVADLVEEDRAAVGPFEAAELSLDGPGEGPLLVAEQLAFEQRLGQGGAVDLDERLVRPQAVVVDGVGDEVLARAALAADQHGRVAVGHLLDQPVHLLHRVARADHVVHGESRLQLPPQPDVLVAQQRPLGLHELVQLDRLGDHRGDDVEQTQAGVEIVAPGPPAGPRSGPRRSCPPA